MEILEDEFNQRQLNVPILTMEETISLLKEL